MPEEQGISAKCASPVCLCAPSRSTLAPTFPFSFSLPSRVPTLNSLKVAPNALKSSKLSFSLLRLKCTEGAGLAGAT